MELLDGNDLQTLLDRNGPLAIDEALEVAIEILKALSEAHQLGIIHRDIKPQNLLLTGALPLDEVNDPERTPEDEAKRKQINFPSQNFSLKIADFGFARHLQTASLAETLCGSPLYMAPEILQHHRYVIFGHETIAINIH